MYLQRTDVAELFVWLHYILLHLRLSIQSHRFLGGVYGVYERRLAVQVHSQREPLLNDIPPTSWAKTLWKSNQMKTDALLNNKYLASYLMSTLRTVFLCDQDCLYRAGATCQSGCWWFDGVRSRLYLANSQISKTFNTPPNLQCSEIRTGWLSQLYELQSVPPQRSKLLIDGGAPLASGDGVRIGACCIALWLFRHQTQESWPF